MDTPSRRHQAVTLQALQQVDGTHLAGVVLGDTRPLPLVPVRTSDQPAGAAADGLNAPGRCAARSRCPRRRTRHPPPRPAPQSRRRLAPGAAGPPSRCRPRRCSAWAGCGRSRTLRAASWLSSCGGAWAGESGGCLSLPPVGGREVPRQVGPLTPAAAPAGRGRTSTCGR